MSLYDKQNISMEMVRRQDNFKTHLFHYQNLFLSIFAADQNWCS